MLDPNAYSWSENESQEEEEKQPRMKEKSSGQESSDESFELTPEQQFFQDHQKEIAQFKQMLKDLKIDVLNSTYEKELPKLIHDIRYR